MECRAYGICLDSQSRGYLGKDRKVSSAAGGNLSRMHKTQETAKESRLNFMYSHLRNRTLELGLFLGARVFASRRRPSSKVCLVMDTEQYRYRDFCSDLAGFDIEGHNGESLQIVRVVRNWLRTNQVEQENIPSGIHIFDRYNQFLEELPELCRPDHLDPNALIFPEYVSLVEAWLLEHAFAVSYWMLRFDPTRIVVTVLSTPLDQS